MNELEDGDFTDNLEYQNRMVLRFSLIFKIIPLMLLIFCLILTIYIVILQKEDWPYLIILYGFFGLPAFGMFLSCILWRVEIHKDFFIYRNYIGIKRKYNYDELELKLHQKGLKWYFYKGDKKVFCMPYYIKDGKTLEKSYKKFKRKIN